MSGVDVAGIPKIKRAIAEKHQELFGGAPAPRIIVCTSCAQEAFFAWFWSGYVLRGTCIRP